MAANPRDRSPRGRSPARPVRGMSAPLPLPAVSRRPTSAVPGEVAEQLTRMDQMFSFMASRMETALLGIQNQQADIARALTSQQQQLDTLKVSNAQRVRLPVSPRASREPPVDRFGALAESSPFAVPPVSQPVPTAPSQPPTAAPAASSSHPTPPAQLDALQRSDKWLPVMPTLDSSKWRNRVDEILGMEQWVDSFVTWLNLVSEAFANEVRYAAVAPAPIERDNLLDKDQKSRGSRLMAMLRQAFNHTPRARIIIMEYLESPGEKNGFEALRRVMAEFMIRSRHELLHFRANLISKTFKANSVTETVKQLEFEEHRYYKLGNMMPKSIPRAGLELLASDLSMVLLRSLPQDVRNFVTMHCSTDSYQDIKKAALKFEANQRLWSELVGNTNPTYLNAATAEDGKGGKGKKGKKGKGGKNPGKGQNEEKKEGKGQGEKTEKEKNSTCFRCQRVGHYASNCHAKKDKDGKPIEEKPKKEGKGGAPEKKGKGKKGKGKGKVHGLLGDQPEGEESSWKSGDYAGSSETPLQPFVSTDGSWFQHTVRAFEDEMFENPFNQPVTFADDVDDPLSELSGFDVKSDDLSQLSTPDFSDVTRFSFERMFFMPVIAHQAVPEDMHWWLIDSGASASVVSLRYIDFYEVIKNQPLKPNEGPGFSSASGGSIHPIALVCLKAFFHMTSTGDPSDTQLKECHLTAFVADVPNNVLSVGNLLQKGWQLGNDGSSLEIRFEKYRMDVSMWQNVPWLYHETEDSIQDFSADRDLSKHFSHRRKLEKPMKSVSFDVRPLLMSTKRKAEEELESDASLNAEVVKPLQHSSEPLDFDVEIEPNTDLVSSHDQVSEHPSILKKREHGLSQLELHRMQGHFPYNPDCVACQASKSTVHHRRKKSGTMSSELACDFFFLEVMPNIKYKFLVMVDTQTGMKGAVPIESDVRSQHSWIQAWLGEFNLANPSKYPLEIITDAETSVMALLKGAITHRALSCVKAAPQGHQTVGAAEAAVRSLKDGFASIRQDLREHGFDVNVDQRIAVNAAVSYLCHCSNHFSNFLDTKQSPKMIALGRPNISRKTTLFGSTVLAEVPESVKKESVSRYERSSYLRPEFSSLGDVVSCVLNGVERVFICKSFKIISPLSWDVSLAPSFIKAFDRSSIPQSIVASEDKREQREKEPVVIDPLQDLSQIKNVPISWLNEHGRTKGCTICEGSQSFHGKKHNRKCIQRYIDWMKHRKESVRIAAPNPPVRLPESTEDHSWRLRGKQAQPSNWVPPQESSEVIPGHELEGGHDVDIDVERPSFEHDSDYSPSILADDPPRVGLTSSPAHSPIAIIDDDLDENMIDLSDINANEPSEAVDAMQVDAIVSQWDPVEIETMTNRHVGFLQSVYQVKGSTPKAEQAELCGETVWIYKPGYVISDVNGQYLDKDLAFQGILTEVESMSKQRVGRVIKEAEALKLAKKWGIQIISTRWVSVEKDPTNVRMRLVAREISKGKGTAKDLMVSSPTSSVESLRLMIAEAAAEDLTVMGLDVSAAFMASPLGKKLGKAIKVILKLPPNTFGFDDGSAVYLEAYKAINGLRSSGLAWVEHLSNLLQELGIKPSMIETTVFSGNVKVGKLTCWVQVVAYVDDLLIFGPSVDAAQTVYDHLAKALKIKQTGLIKGSRLGGGTLRFLGRTLERKPNAREITVSLDDNYLDGIFEAYNITSSSQTPPDLRVILDDENRSAELSPDAALKFKAALGKLSWMSQTMMFLCIYVALLATGMAQPLDRHERAMRAVLRYMRSQKGLCQVFPSSEATQEDIETRKLIIYCDASWAPMRVLKRRSITGACFFYRGSLVKAFSRLQQVVALSSCESELSALAESIQESMGIQRISEHFFMHTRSVIENLHESFLSSERIQGLVSCLIFGIVECESAPCIEIEVRSDSQAAIRVLTGSGLSRKSRHIELRVCFCQNLVKQRAIILTWIEGAFQIADILTKCLGTKLFLRFRNLMGYLESPVLLSKQAKAITRKFYSQSASSKDSAKAIRYNLNSIIYGFRPEFAEIELSDSELRESPDQPSFLNSVKLSSSPTQTLKPSRFRVIKASQFSDVNHDDFNSIFLEVWCENDSLLTEFIFANSHDDVLLVRFTKNSPIENHLKPILSQLSKFQHSFAHFSFPCTGESAVQNVSNDEERKELIEEFFEMVHLCRPLICQVHNWSFELPKRNQCWYDEALHGFLKSSKKTIYANFAYFCSAALKPIGKVYLIASTSKHVIHEIDRFSKCCGQTHLPVNQFSWKQTGRYPRALAESLCRGVMLTISNFSYPDPCSGHLMWDRSETQFRVTKKQLTSSPIS